MKLTNTTPFVAGWTVGFQPDAREVAVVAVKATYDLHAANSGPLGLAAKQQPLFESDVFGADPATDAPVHENDFALFKPECDILFNGAAYTPEGREATRIEAGLRVGDCRKLFTVVGDRRWYRGLAGPQATSPRPFTRQAISYDVAFGGTDVHPRDSERVDTFLRNPVGLGYCKFLENLEGAPLPRTEERGVQISEPGGAYKPMALGPLGRNWLPRYPYAGTYDERWMAEKLPFLPDDFDPRYFQAAPEDQRIPFPTGGEPVVLLNLSRQGRIDASVPFETVWVTVLRNTGTNYELRANLDTLLIEPDESRICLTWRAACVLDRDPFEVREFIVERGETRAPGKSRARLLGKSYYSNLAELAATRRRGSR